MAQWKSKMHMHSRATSAAQVPSTNPLLARDRSKLSLLLSDSYSRRRMNSLSYNYAASRTRFYAQSSKEVRYGDETREIGTRASRFRRNRKRRGCCGMYSRCGLFRRAQDQTINNPQIIPYTRAKLRRDQVSEWFADYAPIPLTTVWNVLKSNYINILLVLFPFAIAGQYFSWPVGVVFGFSASSMAALTAMLSFVIDELSASLSPNASSLLIALLGNGFELIVGAISLYIETHKFIHSLLLGSIIWDLLLALGTAYFTSGLRREYSLFNSTIASVVSSLLVVAMISMAIVTLLSRFILFQDNDHSPRQLMQYATAIILLSLYTLYTFFQLRSHARLFDQEESEVDDEEELDRPEAAAGKIIAPIPAVLMMIPTYFCMGVCARSLLTSANSLAIDTPVGEEFIGLILLPLVGKFSRLFDTCVVAWRDKMDLAVLVTVGGSMQVALFVLPVLVLFSGLASRPLTFDFGYWDVSLLFVSIVVAKTVLMGRSNYLQGAICVGLYLIIALAAFLNK